MFAEPDWDAPIDFDARLAAIPPSAQVRGMFLRFLIQGMDAEAATKVRGRRYLPFKNYSMRDYVELLALSCVPNALVAPGERVRRLGRNLYPTYAGTITGTAIFAAAGHNFRRVLEMAPAAYRVSAETALVTIRSISDQHALVEVRNLWNLPDLHQVGVLEGAMLVCNAVGAIRIRTLSFSDVDFEITWTHAA